MGPHRKGGETRQVSVCLVQDISQPAVHSLGSAEMALDYQRQPRDRHLTPCQLSAVPPTLLHVLAPAL